MLNKPKLIELPKIGDRRGNLSFIEGAGKHIPFTIRRAYWIYDVPAGKVRSGHAFKTQDEFIVALSGSFDVVYSDGSTKSQIHLARSYYGLYVPHLTWRELNNFSTNSIALVLSSNPYCENDYIEDFAQFKSFRKQYGI